MDEVGNVQDFMVEDEDVSQHQDIMVEGNDVQDIMVEGDDVSQHQKAQDSKYQRWAESAEFLLGVISNDIKPFSIGVVPDELRKWNKKAYMPTIVSIGPRYKGATSELQQMEEIKWDCLKHLFNRTQKAPISTILYRSLGRLLDLDVSIRASYVKEIKLDRYELGKIMLNDGCFLLELLLMHGSEELKDKLGSKNEDPEYRSLVARLEEDLTDLILLENQIPLFILIELATSIFPEVFTCSLAAMKAIPKLVRSFLDLPFDSGSGTKFDDRAGHFLELVYVSIFENSKVQNYQESQPSDSVAETKVTIDKESRDVNVKLNRCATKLQAAGVTLTGRKTADSDSKSDPLTSLNFDIILNNGKLEIPTLHITERTEARWRNFIAWEHHKMKGKSFINKQGPHKFFPTYQCKCTMAALFFNGLICCASDVQLLKNKEIIDSNMSNQDLVDLFSSIPMGVDPTIIYPSYVKMFHDLNSYSATPYVISIPIILWHYSIILWHYLRRSPEVIYSIRRFFRKGYNFVAATLSVLTILQTVYTIVNHYDMISTTRSSGSRQA